jgi:hypothetical protein
MDVQQLVKRRTIAISFSKDFESLLLNAPMPHASLTDDLETAAKNGLLLLEDLEDVREIKHKDTLHELIIKTNQFSKITSEHFTKWHINVSEDLLDEVDLVILAHGDDLKELGLVPVNQGMILLLLAVSSLT